MAQGKTLSRDYKHVKRHTPGGHAFSGWTGLAIGLAAGLSVAFGVFLHYRMVLPAEPQPATAKAPASAQAADDQPSEPTDPAKDYTFYNMLPQQEVEVPTEGQGRRFIVRVADRGRGAAGRLVQAARRGGEAAGAARAVNGVDAKIQRGAVGEVTVPIPPGGVGEASVMVGAQRFAAPARDDGGAGIPRGTAVVVRRMAGTTLIVSRRDM